MVGNKSCRKQATTPLLPHDEGATTPTMTPHAKLPTLPVVGNITGAPAIALATEAMRPSATFNAALAAL